MAAKVEGLRGEDKSLGRGEALESWFLGGCGVVRVGSVEVGDEVCVGGGGGWESNFGCRGEAGGRGGSGGGIEARFAVFGRGRHRLERGGSGPALAGGEGAGDESGERKRRRGGSADG